MKDFHLTRASPSKLSSQLTFLMHRLWKRIFMLIVNGANRPIGSKILADSFSTDRLVTGRLCAYSIDSERSHSHHLELCPSKCRVSSQIVLFAIQQLLHLMILLLWLLTLSFWFGGASTVNWFFFSSSCFIRSRNDWQNSTYVVRIPLLSWFLALCRTGLQFHFHETLPLPDRQAWT